MKTARKQLAIALATVLIAPIATVAASTSSFTGKTAQKVKISFRASTTSVSDLKTSLDVLCLTAYPASKSATEIIAIRQQRPAALRGGKFTLTLPAPIAHPSKREVTTITGTIHGQSASGTLKSFYLKNWQVYNPATGMYDLALASCAGKSTWTARR
ncbi:MAG TPA: hypothetical protein VMT10_13605 [Solirubrobacteraceae bacterium]|nr:hypothetical protein [Solirubrobacteraceae bacterium]